MNVHSFLKRLSLPRFRSLIYIHDFRFLSKINLSTFYLVDVLLSVHVYIHGKEMVRHTMGGEEARRERDENSACVCVHEASVCVCCAYEFPVVEASGERGKLSGRRKDSNHGSVIEKQMERARRSAATRRDIACEWTRQREKEREGGGRGVDIA